MSVPDITATAASPDDLVVVEALSRDHDWRRHYGLSYPGQVARAVAEGRVAIARRIWRGGEYRIVPAGRQ